jgi:hypothetical protein
VVILQIKGKQVMKTIKLSMVPVVLAMMIAIPPSIADDSPSLKSFEKCAHIEGNMKRLACFDDAASNFDFKRAEAALAESVQLKAEAERLRAEAETARRAEEHLLAEAEARKAAVEAKKREEFGKRDAEVRTVNLIEDEILRIKKPKVGGLIIMLKNSQVWQQVDANRTGPLKPGMEIRIKKTMMGGYLMTIKLSRKVIRVKRLI